ncbi:MAG TPA: TlpA disulfide reductase family protein [Chthonomonadaceae bacterium]|nr:TlpA disulfide reductase family protein [Chthonomonadaceae bacterium]
MVNPVRALFVALALTALAGGSMAQPAPTRPAELLKWSMSKYAAMPTFQADCAWTATYGGMPTGQSATRSLWYRKPNVFKVVTMQGRTGMGQTSVSDGAHLTEFTTGLGLGGQRYPAPPSIAAATSMQMNHPMFCGSLLYKFFGGPGSYAALVNEAKKAVSFGAPVTVGGQSCKTVKIYAQGPSYGNAEIAIGADGLVRRIQYDSEPLMKMMQSDSMRKMVQQMMNSPEVQAQIKKHGGTAPNGKALQDAMASAKNLPTTSITSETYSRIVVGKPIDAAVFRAAPPKTQPVQDVGAVGQSRPPVALGKPAPAVAVTELEGGRRTLGDFKGKVVLIDFWATWCPPCRKGLPETQRFYQEYGSRGLAVLAVSDESKATVKPFLKQNRFTFPTYLDKGGIMGRAFGVTAIPTVAVIDRNGRLSSYLVGLSPRQTILAALKKAGLDVR